jgi:hypothetical protein
VTVTEAYTTRLPVAHAVFTLVVHKIEVDVVPLQQEQACVALAVIADRPWASATAVFCMPVASLA